MTVFHHHGPRQLHTDRGSYSLWDQPDPEVPTSSLAAARSLDDGYYFTAREDLNYLNGPEEYRARKSLNHMLHRVEQWHGPLPTKNGDLSDIQCWGLQKLRRWGCLTRDWWDKLKKMSKAECTETIVPKATTKKEQFTGIGGTYNPHLKRWVIQSTGSTCTTTLRPVEVTQKDLLIAHDAEKVEKKNLWIPSKNSALFGLLI